MDFEIEYTSPIEKIKNEPKKESRTFEKNNTFVPKPYFKSFL